MASKGTPKKFYEKLSGSTVISRCRLCNSVADPNYSRNLFRDANILRNAEAVYGGKFPQDINLPHLACRACVRRLNNFSQYRNVITETQRKLTEDVRTKRCLELSPSVAKPSAKVQAIGGSRRRSLDFGADSGAPGQSESSLHVSRLNLLLLKIYSYSSVFYPSFYPSFCLSCGIFSPMNNS